MVPDPGLLDKSTWAQHVLPAMAPHLGIQVYGESDYVNTPGKQGITYEDWMKLVGWYKSTAPNKLAIFSNPISPDRSWSGFALRKPSGNFMTVSTTTMVAFDTLGRKIYTADMLGSSLNSWTNGLKHLFNYKLPSPPVNARFLTGTKGREEAVITCIGSMKAVDIANGTVASYNLSKPKSAVEKNVRPGNVTSFDQPEAIIGSGIPRPVQSLPADFNKDGLTDWLVCGFGHNIGGLYWLKQLPDHSFEKRVIRNMSGALHAEIGDFNHDGYPDIICLFAQADEGIWLFLNDKKGGFTIRNLLRFPSVYGSSSFQLADFNHDGLPDIVYTCGDNSDYSRILKPYHGVYVFTNQGDFKFKQTFFYHINGATKAVAADFNGDKKPDIAVIAFFSDLKENPAEGFTYLEQTSAGAFVPHNLPIEKSGRWISMDVKDYNYDGKPDIILGNFSLGFINQEGVKKDWDQKTPYIVLENRAE